MIKRSFLIQFKILTLLLMFGVATSLISQAQYHQVEKGDTVFSLAKEYTISVPQIVKQNNLSSASAIYIGQKLLISVQNQTKKDEAQSSWGLYKIKKGDTLYSLARTHNIELNEVMRFNGFKKGVIIKPGLLIRLPNINSQNSKIANKTVVTQNSSFVSKNVGQKISENGLQWPAKGQIRRLKGKFQGVQISSKKGTAVTSIASGKVIWSAPFRGYGKMIMVQSRDGLTYTYCGNEKLFVREGDFVKPGTRIGTVGLNSHDNSPKIIFLVYNGEKAVDPLKAPRQ